jgi:hypothetical protein
MNGIRRGLVLLGLTVAVINGASIPASAGYADSVAVTTTVNTTTVAAPTSVVGKLTCGHPTATMAASWALSPTKGVSGYVVTVYFSDGVTQAVQLLPTATSWSAPITDYYVTAYSIQYSLTTQTTYGWTKESPRTAAFQC